MCLYIVADRVLWEMLLLIVATPFIREIDMLIWKMVYSMSKAMIRHLLLHIIIALQPIRVYVKLRPHGKTRCSFDWTV